MPELHAGSNHSPVQKESTRFAATAIYNSQRQLYVAGHRHACFGSAHVREIDKGGAAQNPNFGEYI